MGCDTKGYIIGIDFLPLCAIVQDVVTRYPAGEGSPYLSEEGIKLNHNTQGIISSASIMFVYDTEADHTNRFRPNPSEHAENRMLFLGVFTDRDPRSPWEDEEGNPLDAEDVQYGYLSLGMWGSADEIINDILSAAKNKGYEVWFLQNDCDGEIIQV